MKDKVHHELRKPHYQLHDEEEILKGIIDDMRKAFKSGDKVTYYRYKYKPKFLGVKSDEFLFIKKYKYLFEMNGFTVEYDSFRKREDFTERIEEYVTISDSNNINTDL